MSVTPQVRCVHEKLCRSVTQLLTSVFISTIEDTLETTDQFNPLPADLPLALSVCLQTFLGLSTSSCDMGSRTRVPTQTQRGRSGKKWVGLNYDEKEKAKEANGL